MQLIHLTVLLISLLYEGITFDLGPRKNMPFEKKPHKSTAKVILTTPIPQVYNQNPGNVQCCNAVTCFNPCPYPLMPTPMYQVPPIVVPVRSYFEPVIHDHPPLEEIKRMIKVNKRKTKLIYTSSSLEEEYSNTSSAETDSFEYYNDFIYSKG